MHYLCLFQRVLYRQTVDMNEPISELEFIGLDISLVNFN